MSNIEDYSIEIDAELLSQDIDEVDLYAERTIENDSTIGDDLIFE